MATLDALINTIIHGDCIDIMHTMPEACIDLVVTDPPYVTRYQSRDGRTLANDDNTLWIEPAYKAIYRVLKHHSFCISTYGWNKVGIFSRAWGRAGFRPIGHFVWVKTYPSSIKFTKAQHEMAYLLVKGDPPRPENPPKDVLNWKFSGNHRHPTEQAMTAVIPFIKAFSKPGDIVLDPFCGSGTTAVAAAYCGRRYIGIELDEHYATIAEDRIKRMEATYAKAR